MKIMYLYSKEVMNFSHVKEVMNFSHVFHTKLSIHALEKTKYQLVIVASDNHVINTEKEIDTSDPLW